MAKIILNPTTGADISNVQLRGQKYFADKPFAVDTMIKLEDDNVADDLLALYEFLVYMTPEDAKGYKDEQAKRKYACDKCDGKFTTEQGLEGHVAKHLEEERLEKELGIEIIDAPEKVEEVVEVNPQDAIDKEARLQGLDYGEGLKKL